MTTFKAKARAVELLGKGQIADLPTAITELWKNGYDAYATNLECRLYLEGYEDNQKPFFLLSDNGFGMSHTDILEKWFVLGTDSKARGHKIAAHFGLAPRPPMGEKGIGRLSVAYLGSQMLMLSKKQGEIASGVLLDWRILENYEFYLSDLIVPTFTFESEEEFTARFETSKIEFKSNLRPELWKEQSAYCSLILSEWEKIDIPNFATSEIISQFFQSDYHGTTFLIFSPIELLTQISQKDRIELKDDKTLNYIRASLSGLHNDLRDTDRDFDTHFYVLDSGGRYDLIDEFLTQQEMRNADHWLKGEFDEFGFFTGELRVFNKRMSYTFKPNRPPGRTSYGAFKIEWGSIEGSAASSLLNDEQYGIVNEKLKLFGGLYVYRDSFRVLPYGRTEADFLDFEKRRNLGAGYYFFAHRRFIGYIDITRKDNAELIDKAGREGFIQNKAYREFRDDLSEFFIDIAVRHMRRVPEGEEPTTRQSQIDDIKEKYDKQLKASKKKNLNTKKFFIEQLGDSAATIEVLEKDISQLGDELRLESENLRINYNNYNKLVSLLESKKAQLRNIKILKPRGIKISSKQQETYELYQKVFSRVEDQVKACNIIVEQTRGRLNVENLRTEFNEKYSSQLKFIERQFLTFQSQSKEAFERILRLLKEESELETERFQKAVLHLRLENEDDTDSISEKIRFLDLIGDEQKNSIDNGVRGFINHLLSLQIDVDDDFLRGWYQEQAENLQKRLADYEELAQLGISIEIIDHQFNVMYSQMNDAVSAIQGYTKKYPELASSYKSLNTAFQHLEGNYKLLKPLYRTSRRTREIITGAHLEQYISEFFANEFSRYDIKFSVNEEFKSYEFFSYDSIVKPVFLNIINNANYWLIPARNREIRIEASAESIRIMNSGEKIDDSYLEDVFTLFFTRKREGRGIGLYLAKKNLNSIGYDIHASNDSSDNKLNGACFVITKTSL